MPGSGLFDVWSRFYDEAAIQRFMYRPVHDAVLAEIDLEPPARLLDLGCGTGLLTTRIRRERAVPSVTGADFSQGMLDVASQSRPDIEWVRTNAGCLPFADESFDTIVSTEAFHWFPDQPRALRECCRVLAPGGRLLVALVHPDFALIADTAGALSRLIGQPLVWPSRSKMREMLESAGLSVATQTRIWRPIGGVLLPPVLTVARKS
jgi:SAM-dependent methyltransferase